jgi:FkbM family methyltransferase
VLKLLRHVVERFPAVAGSYRQLRDYAILHTRTFTPTGYGFSLIAPPGTIATVSKLAETRLLNALMRDAEVFVDVGANIGFYTALARSLSCHTIAVEPLSQNLRYLYANLLQNGWSDVEVYPVGLSAQPGLAELYGASTGASLVSGWADASKALKRTIPLSTLDVIIGHRFQGRPLLLKIDVEGAEHSVLTGASEILQRDPKPTWLVEICLTEHHPSGINSHFRDIFERFWKLGYEARTADDERRRISPEDVDSWVRLRQAPFGSPNYWFQPRAVEKNI